MPSDSIAGFLDHAQANQVLFPEQVEQLIRQADLPHSNLASLCEYLLSRGVLTRFQAESVRDGRGQELNFAGYPVIDDLGPCPGGTSYKVLHPSLRTPLLLRRLRTDWLAPADNAAAFVHRARAFGMLPHANIAPLLDVGFYRDELYAVLDAPGEAADLDALSREIGGAMPGFLAAEYGRAVASALRMVHERGGVHGDIRPINLVVGPLTIGTGPDGSVRRRPAPDAVVQLAELGLLPARPSAAASAREPAALAYLPPERVDSDTDTPNGDVYGLGATLYYLLTGRAPFPADAPELLARVRSGDPAPLAALRPDLPAELTAIASRMMAKDPDSRPVAYEVEAALVPFCRPGTVPLPPAHPADGHLVAAALPTAIPIAEAVDVWGADPNAFSMSHTDGELAQAPRRREMTTRERGRSRLLLVLGGMLHLTAIALIIAWAVGAFEASPVPDQQPGTPEKNDGNKKDGQNNKKQKGKRQTPSADS